MTMSMTSLKNEVQYIRNSQSKSVRGGPAQKKGWREGGSSKGKAGGE